MHLEKSIIKAVCLIICLTCAFTYASGQAFTVKGRINDTSGIKRLNEASILVLNEKDSLLIDATRSKGDGTFNFNNLKKGQYILLITYPNYVDYTDHFKLDGPPLVKYFDSITMTPKSILMKEVLISFKKVSAVRFKGDTTEFDAVSFKVKPNATVEDLLKQFPGLSVDKDGKITANGKTVEKVLVDGEEFFGDDPTLVTRNLKATMVDKVQLYEKTTDQAAFTGIDDGKKITTLDVKIKKDQKNGYFGSVEAGGGTGGFYQNQALFNRFLGDEKIAGYFIMSNTGKIGLDRGSQRSYATGDSNPIANELDSWNGTYNGVGIPQSVAGGLHYDNKWNSNNESINANYKLGNLDLSGQQTTITQNNLPGSAFISTSTQDSKKQILRQGLNIAYDVKLDSTSELKIFAEGALISKTTDESDSSATLGQNQTPLNNSIKKISTNGNVNAFGSNILWQKKLRRGRTVSINFNSKVDNNSSTGNFYTKSNFFDAIGKLDSTQVFDQRKKAENHSELYGIRTAYTEPLGKQGSIIANYGVVVENARAELESFDKLPNGGYSATIDSIYSNNYLFNQFSNKGGLAYVYKTRKGLIQVGSDVELDRFDQQNLFNNSSLHRSFVNWYPMAKLSYNFSSSNTFSFTYNGISVEPTIQQLQPFVNNNDPLNLYVGNTLLTPSFTNKFLVSYQLFKGVKYLDIRGDYSLTSNPIALSAQTNGAAGTNVYTFVNLSAKKTASYSGSFLFRDKLKFWNLDYGADGGVNGEKYAGISNGLINTTTSATYKLNFVVSKAVDSLYYIGTGFGTNYNVNSNTLLPSISNNSWGFLVNPTIEFYFHGLFQFHTDGNYTWQGKTQTFDSNFSRFIWNASISKQFLRKKNLSLKLSANDILNQNVGFNRNAYANIIVQNSYTTVARYFMASVIWDFNKSGLKK